MALSILDGGYRDMILMMQPYLEFIDVDIQSSKIELVLILRGTSYS